MKFKIVPIATIFDSPSTNSGLKKKDVLLEQKSDDYIPVYSASKDEKYVFGWVHKDSNWKKYKNVLTWVKDGSSSGYVCYRTHFFVPYEKVKLLRLKPEFEKTVNYEYARKVIELKLLSMGYGWGFKCSMERVLETEIQIPINEFEEYDYSIQLELVKKYSLLDNLKRDIFNTFKEFSQLRFNFSSKVLTKPFLITDIFTPVKGNQKYTQDYIRNHIGDFPVYSSQTTDDGIIGYIDTYDYDEQCLTWTTDGIYAGTVFYRIGKFSMSTHCGALLLKKEFISSVDLNYVFLYLNTILKDFAIGEGNKRLTIDIINNVSIELPVNVEGGIDLSGQRIISQKYIKLYDTVKELNKYFKDINESIIEFQP
jgi:restriction endonuclease S subunit